MSAVGPKLTSPFVHFSHQVPRRCWTYVQSIEQSTAAKIMEASASPRTATLKGRHDV